MYRNSTNWVLSGTETQRLSSRKMITGQGTNLQNPSDDICRIYVPDEGKIFVQVDQFGADALIVSWLTRHGLLRDLFNLGSKPHVYLGLAFPNHWEKDFPFIRELPIENPVQVFAHPEWKKLAKAIKDSDSNPPSSRFYYLYKQTCHSANYDIKTPTFIFNVLQKSDGKVVLSKREGDLFLGTYRTLFSELAPWHIEIQEQIRETRTLYNLQGFPRYFGGPFSEKLYKEAYAHIPQSTVATITNEAYVEAQDWLDHEREDWDLLPQKHDSILCQCPVDEALICGKWLKSLVERPLQNNRGEQLRMKADISTGFNWSKHREDSNPFGMKEIKL